MNWKLGHSILLLLVLALLAQSKAQTPTNETPAAEQPASVPTATGSSPDSSVDSVKVTGSSPDSSADSVKATGSSPDSSVDSVKTTGSSPDSSVDSVKATGSSPDSSVDSVKATGGEEPRDYELGPGDLIHVSVWHEQELTQTAVVRPDGKISLPLAGEIPVAGKTALEAQLLVSSKLLRFITDPQVTVSVLEIHSRQVFITGQVQRPGSYPLTGSVSVLQLIASAGGLTQYAHRKGIVILDSKNQATAKFDYTTAIKGKVRDEKPLQPGDTVVVP